MLSASQLNTFNIATGTERCSLLVDEH